ncbi:peptide-binding protein [Alkalihalobacillus sp. AL-G]|uniref:peptide-binding protein n=1 Tax=Alkalihalobacillus sp. AL-G TaxID=2926399 RepID=UPI00272A808A|nr:peptide-binding protein [Alkalihalobacillus sp. AL-G]WLD95361.1 peptide-binding protein [Alkalihalobacillus sp. AL-G]
MFLAACNANPETKEPSNEGTEGSEEEKPEGPQEGGDLIVGSIGAPTLFNDLYSTDISSSDISEWLYDGLVRFNEKLEPEPAIAKEWKISEDGTIWTFYLNEGITFHDGEPLTADDVVFTYSIPLHEDYVGARASNFEKIEKIEAVDDHTVKITLKEPFAPFFVTAAYGILPEHILKDVPIAELGEHEFNTKSPIGSGPFKFEEWKEGQYVKVTANENYYKGRPYLDSITYKIVPDANALMAQLAAGDVHEAAVQSPDLATAKDLEEKGKIQLSTNLSLGYTYIGWNQKNELFQDVKVRQALTMAIDREAIIGAVLNGDGEIAHAPSSPLSWAYNPDVAKFNFDVEKAKALLEEAGWTPGDDGILQKDGKRFSFELKTNQGNKAREQIATIVQQQLKQIGIEVQPKIMEWSAFIEDVTAPNWNYDACILGWSLSADPDPTDLWHSKEREQGLNFVHFSDPELDKLMEQNTKELDQEKRKEIIAEIQSGIAEQQPYTFLYYPNDHYALDAKLRGHVHHPSSEFYMIEKWWLEQ